MSTPRLLLCAALFLCLPALPGRAAFWASSSGADVGTVEASGTGRVKVEATRAAATVVVSGQNKTVDDLNNALGQRSRAVLAFLDSQKAEGVRTEAVQIAPHYDFVNGVRRQDGFDGRIVIRFEAETKEIGALVTGALGSGANEVQGVDTAPLDKDQEAARKTAIALAVQDALAQARAALGAADLKESRIRHLSVSAGGGGPMPMFKAMAAGAATPLPIEGGTQEVVANVQVTLEFQK